VTLKGHKKSPDDFDIVGPLNGTGGAKWTASSAASMEHRTKRTFDQHIADGLVARKRRQMIPTIQGRTPTVSGAMLAWLLRAENEASQRRGLRTVASIVALGANPPA
jgi:hypothetical protein